MKILTEEIALRDQTRSFHQAKAQLKKEVAKEKNEELSTIQNDLTDRTDDVIEQIRDLPDGEASFGKEIKQLTSASFAMGDACDFLAESDTGPNAIAAETEAIEWLLLAKRSGSGGGGGGTNAGAGTRSGAAWRGSSLARLGGAKEKLSKVVKRNTNQATGKAGRNLPEEYRSGLDEYFEKLESKESTQ
jgi:hypothetical protein